MAILANPPSYLTAAAFKQMPNDYDLSSYTDAQIQDHLNRASGVADAIMRKSHLWKERVIRMLGSGTNRLELRLHPVLYVKKAQIVVPGSTGPLIPIDQLLIDFTSGSLLEYTPMVWAGQGYFARFPEGVPVDVTIGTGYGYTFSPPTYTITEGTGATGLTPGATYNLAVTTKTMWGETTATVQPYTTAAGVFNIAINPTLGGYLYRAFLSPAANNTTLNGATIAGANSFVLNSVGTIAVNDVLMIENEYLTVSAVNAGTKTITTSNFAVNPHANGVTVMERLTLVAESPFTAYGAASLSMMVNNPTPPTGYWKDAFPILDNSAAPVPFGIIEAVRLLALMGFYEQNNLSNRGIYRTTSGRKGVMWRSTEGTSGRGVPLMMEQAINLLKPYGFQDII